MTHYFVLGVFVLLVTVVSGRGGIERVYQLLVILLLLLCRNWCHDGRNVRTVRQVIFRVCRAIYDESQNRSHETRHQLSSSPKVRLTLVRARGGRDCDSAHVMKP